MASAGIGGEDLEMANRVTQRDDLVERLRRTKMQHRVTHGFGGLVSFNDETETREAPINPDGPEAAAKIERLTSVVAEIDRVSNGGGDTVALLIDLGRIGKLARAALKDTDGGQS